MNAFFVCLLLFSALELGNAFGVAGTSSCIMRRSPVISNRGGGYVEEPSASASTRASSASGARSMSMMPIGIPKVAYRMPGSRGGEWVDIYQRLTRERIIFMGSEIDDEMANQIIGVVRLSCLSCSSSSTLFVCVRLSCHRSLSCISLTRYIKTSSQSSFQQPPFGQIILSLILTPLFLSPLLHTYSFCI